MLDTDVKLSPCAKICIVDPLSGLCVGCGRTVEEISMWREMGDDARRRTMAELPRRLAHARSRAARGGRVSARQRRSDLGWR
jgi:predicted Fe-S protein YdhL (DUF1289 family)